MKRILFTVILILNSFLFGCNENLDISLNTNEENNYSVKDSDLSEYRKEIEELYVELKSSYENIKKSRDLDEWKAFKDIFNSKLIYIKDKVSGTKLKYSIENLENLYNEYDKEINHNNI